MIIMAKHGSKLQEGSLTAPYRRRLAPTIGHHHRSYHDCHQVVIAATIIFLVTAIISPVPSPRSSHQLRDAHGSLVASHPPFHVLPRGTILLAAAEQCGRQAGNAVCPGGLCCSEWGWCGSTSAYCSGNCQSNCWGQQKSPPPQKNSPPPKQNSPPPKQKSPPPKQSSPPPKQKSPPPKQLSPPPPSARVSSPPPPALRGSPPPPSGTASDFARISYFTNWATYRTSPNNFPTSKIDATHFTHIMYAFAFISSSFQVVPSDTWNDITQGGFSNFQTRVRTTNPSCKTLISIGGASASAAFSPMAATATSRATFVASAIQFARTYGFDGLDLDWELPNNPTDKANFMTLIKLLRTEVQKEAGQSGRSPLLLTAAVAAWKPSVVASYDVPTMNTNLDLVGVMTYDLHGSWESQTGLHTALDDAARPDLSIKGAVDAWVSLGLNPKKLVMGLASYGRGWTLQSMSNVGVNAPASGPSTAPPYTQESGFMSYYEILSFIANGATVVVDSSRTAMYTYKGAQWIGYDNENTISQKVKYARSAGLGGYMFWAMDLDSNYALAKAAKNSS